MRQTKARETAASRLATLTSGLLLGLAICIPSVARSQVCQLLNSEPACPAFSLVSTLTQESCTPFPDGAITFVQQRKCPGTIDLDPLPNRPLLVSILRMDLRDPSIHFLVTPQPQNLPVGTGVLLRTTSFVIGFGLDGAINANFFDLLGLEGDERQIRGLAISDGRLLSEIRCGRDWEAPVVCGDFGDPQVVSGDPGDPAVVFLEQNGVQIGRFDSVPLPFPLQAIAGIGPEGSETTGTLLVKDGQNLGASARVLPDEQKPRTAIGVSGDGNELLLVTIDGLRDDFSEGMTLPELADLLIREGSYHAVNLDGGGSTEMVLSLTGGVTVVNSPSDGSERPVPIHLGFFVDPSPDLRTLVVDTGVDEVQPGETIEVGTTVSNRGAQPSGPFQVGIYLSEDEVIDGGDTLLGSFQLSSLDSQTASSNLTFVTIPTGATPGSAFLGAFADSLDEVDEVNEANNFKAIPVQILADDPFIGCLPIQLNPNTAMGSNAQPETFTLCNAGTGTLSYSVTDDVGWLDVSPSSGDLDAGQSEGLLVSYATAALPPGQYQATIHIDGGAGTSNSPQIVDVTLTVNPAGTPVLEVFPSTLFQTSVFGETPSQQSLFIRNAGAGALNYTVAESEIWLDVRPSNGSSTGETDEIRVSYYTSSNLPEGTYAATIEIASPDAANSPEYVEVTFVQVDGPEIVRFPTLLTPEALVGESPPSDSIFLGNSGVGNMSYAITDDAAWLSVPLSSGSVLPEEIDELEVLYSTDTLEQGVYNATIEIAAPHADNSPQTVSVTLLLPEPGLAELQTAGILGLIAMWALRHRKRQRRGRARNPQGIGQRSQCVQTEDPAMNGDRPAR